MINYIKKKSLKMEEIIRKIIIVFVAVLWADQIQSVGPRFPC